MQKEVLLSHKLRIKLLSHNPFRLKEDKLSQSNCQNHPWSHPGLSHKEQECQDSLMQGKIHNQ